MKSSYVFVSAVVAAIMMAGCIFSDNEDGSHVDPPRDPWDHDWPEFKPMVTNQTEKVESKVE